MEVINKKKEYNKNYFQKCSKLKFLTCNVCNKNFKYNSYLNHLKSKKHFINSTNEEKYIDEINEDIQWINNDLEDLKLRIDKLNEKIKNI